MAEARWGGVGGVAEDGEGEAVAGEGGQFGFVVEEGVFGKGWEEEEKRVRKKERRKTRKENQEN